MVEAPHPDVSRADFPVLASKYNHMYRNVEKGRKLRPKLECSGNRPPI